MAYDDVAVYGVTSRCYSVFMRDSTTGQGKTGLAYSAVTASYWRDGAAATVSISLSDGVLGTYVGGASSGSWKEQGNGWYQFCAPNNAFAAGVNGVDFLFTASGAINKTLRVLLGYIDIRDAVRGGLTALPNANANAVGGLGVLDANSNLPADVKRWLGNVPAALSATGAFLQVMVTRWITDTTAGTPNALQSNRVDTYVGANNDKTGYALTSGEHTLIAADTQTGLTAQGYNTARAALLDKLNITGNVASSGEVTAIQNNTSTRFVVPDFFERPDAGSTAFLIHLYIYDENGNMEAPDSTPAITVVNEAGTDRSANLGAVTLVGVGHYKATYTVASNATAEQLIFEATIVEGGATRIAGSSAWIVDTSAVDFTAADRTMLTAIQTDYARRTGDYATPTNVSDAQNAITNAIGALNNLSAVQAQAAATDALNAYDPPTNAEMEARTRVAAEYALEATFDAIKGAGWSNQTLAALYVQIGLRLLSSSYVAPDNTGISNIANAVNTIPDTADIKDAATDALTDYDVAKVSDVTGGSGGATAQEVWEYGDRQLTDFGFAVDTNPNAVETAIGEALVEVAEDVSNMRARLAAQVAEPEPVLVIPGTAPQGFRTVIFDLDKYDPDQVGPIENRRVMVRPLVNFQVAGTGFLDTDPANNMSKLTDAAGQAPFTLVQLQKYRAFLRPANGLGPYQIVATFLVPEGEPTTAIYMSQCPTTTG